MTCREKLKIEYPDKLNPLADGGCMGCPKGYGYLPDPYYCKHHGDPELCTKCWDREIPEIEETKEDVKMDTNKTYMFEDVRQMSEYEKTDLIMKLQKEKDVLNDEIKRLALDISRLEKSRCCDERVKTLEEEIDKLRTENKNLAESNYVLNDHIDEYEFVIKEADKKKAELEDKNRKLKDERDWLDKCYHDWVKEATDRSEKIKKIEKEKDDLDCVLHNKIEELEYEIELKNKNLEDKNKHINHLIERLDDQRKKIEDLENGDVLPYFIRKVVGDKLKEDPCCWATSAEKRSYIEDPFCKSVPCSEAIKQLEKKVDDIPCIKAKIKPVDKFIASCWNDGTGIKAKEAYDYIIEDMKRIQELCNAHSYNKIAERMMRKYQALRHAGFDHDTALSFIPMWSDE